MNTLSRFSIAAALLLSIASPALAERVELKGVGAAAYDAKGGQNAANAAEARAVGEARQAAWRNFVAAQTPSRQQVIARHEAEFGASLDKFIIESVVVASQKDAGNIKVVVRVAFNDEAVARMVSDLSVGGGNAQAPGGQPSVFTFLFMARKATSITQFDARRSAVRQAVAANSTADDGGVTATRNVTVGGSSLQKADAVTYEVTSSQDIDAAMGEVLQAANIDYVGYDDIVNACHGLPKQRFQAEYVQADELSPQTRGEVINAARACDVRYFATGTIDTEVATIDPVTGGQKVFVSVRSQLWDLSKKLPRKIGSVGPTQYSGLGENQSVAGRNALALASRDAMKSLVDQLNAKGIR
jgi:hypothetical protein